MTPDGKSIFREIAKGLAPEQRTEFWEMAAHLEKLSPDDEILRVCQAMGVLTLITQKIPVELAAQREAWLETCTAFRNELREALQKAQEQSILTTNQVAGLAQEVGATGQLVVKSAEKVEKALRHGADGFSTEKLAQDVRAKMEATILKPTEEIVKQSTETVQRFEKSIPKFEGVADRLENFNYQSAWGTAVIVCSVVAILLVGVIWLKLEFWYHDTLAKIRANFDQTSRIVDVLDKTHHTAYLTQQDDKYYIVVSNADSTFVSPTHDGVIVFKPKP
jgi:hypothetical protein